ncbi:MAG: amino acid ABC transporter substrate-binding protein [Rhodobacteraceae bacterium]|nr:MAG: amino acid ABC transporter substrate-binding protein [Paracoccaceae bacterium]
MTGKDVLNRRSLLQGGALGAGSAAMLGALNARAQTGGDPIAIGSALPMSGVAAADGAEFRRGLELAAEEINAAGGILGRPVTIHVEDTADMGADIVTQAMQRLIDRHDCSAIINGYNVGTNMVEMDVAADNDVIFVHYNTLISHNEKFLTDPDRYYGCFQGDPPEYWYGPGFLLFLRNLIDTGQWTPPNNKIAIIPSANEYSIVIANAIRDQLAEFGFELSLYETVPFPTSQWGPTLARLRQDPPAAIAVTHFLPQDLAQFMVQFLADPTQSLIYMQYGPSLPAFREIGQEAINGTLYSTVVGCLPDDFSANFRETYRAKHGPTAAFLTGSQTYDGLWHYALSAAIAGGPGAPFDGEQNRRVAEAMRRLIYRGVNGIYRVDLEGQSGYCYPTQIGDPSLGMAHQFIQHQDYREDPKLIAPALYATHDFVMPPWITA